MSQSINFDKIKQKNLSDIKYNESNNQYGKININIYEEYDVDAITYANTIKNKYIYYEDNNKNMKNNKIYIKSNLETIASPETITNPNTIDPKFIEYFKNHRTISERILKKQNNKKYNKNVKCLN